MPKEASDLADAEHRTSARSKLKDRGFSDNTHRLAIGIAVAFLIVASLYVLIVHRVFWILKSIDLMIKRKKSCQDCRALDFNRHLGWIVSSVTKCTSVILSDREKPA
jgi:hypothetical protein